MSEQTQTVFEKLKEPFPAKDIEWRIARKGFAGEKPWAMVLAYVTNRAIMDRLDNTVGPDNWYNKYDIGPQGGVICGLSVRCNGEWITKWDGAENTQVESVKGGLSDSMKRAGVQWGIGRYLYNLEENFAECVLEKKRGDDWRYVPADKKNNQPSFSWKIPALPAWALPYGDQDTAKISKLRYEKPKDPKKGAISEAQADDLAMDIAFLFKTPEEGKSYIKTITDFYKVGSLIELEVSQYNQVCKQVAKKRSEIDAVGA